MKNSYILLVFAILSAAVSCKNSPSGNDGLAGNENLVLIGNKFRSESDILAPKSEEGYLGNFNNKLLLDEVFKAIYEGRVQCYDYLDNPLSIDEVRKMESSVDTTLVENFETGEQEQVVVKEELNRDDIVRMFVTENWYFDKKNFNIEKEVLSLIFTTKKFDLDGNPIGYNILFKVYLNGKKPV